MCKDILYMIAAGLVCRYNCAQSERLDRVMHCPPPPKKKKEKKKKKIGRESKQKKKNFLMSL